MAHHKAWLRNQLNKNEREIQTALKRLEPSQPSPLSQSSESSQSSQPSQSSESLLSSSSNKESELGIDSSEHPSKLSYENNVLKLTVEQVDHKQEKRFRLSDHLFNFRLLPKQNQMPMLTEILTFLHAAFIFILTKIKKFYNPEDKNIAFMTIVQSPMVNGLNTGGFELHEDTASAEMVDRLLSMLNQYLISNKTLQLDETFKVYLKILSAQHSRLNETKKRRSRRGRFGKLHVGSKELKGIYSWALEAPSGSIKYPNVFKNKCLLVSFLFGLSQHEYFEGKNRDFKYLLLIQSKNENKQNHAIKIMQEKLFDLYNLTNLPINGPYALIQTIDIVCKIYHCQVFVFEGIVKSGSKLLYMFPDLYDPKLKPIFLFKPNANDHVVFIKNVNSYFRKNGFFCFACKKAFRSVVYKHFCKSLKSCFACHRFFRSKETYFHSKLNFLFCDRFTSKENETLCPLCNITLYTINCKNAHKRLCNSKGYFGYKCLDCSRFTFRHNNLTSQQLKENHNCSTQFKCKICHEIKTNDHLCRLRCKKLPNYHISLAFLRIDFSKSVPLLATCFVEDKIHRGRFCEFVIADSDLNLPLNQNFSFSFDYFSNSNLTNLKNKFVKKKPFAKRLNNSFSLFEDSFLKFLLSFDVWISFIICDNNNFQFLFLLQLFCKFGICPDVLKQGPNFLLIEIKDFGIRFLNSVQFVPGEEYELAKHFEIPFEKIVFPYQMLMHLDNLNYSDKCPEEFFFMLNNNLEDVKDYLSNNKGRKYNLKKEIIQFAHQKTLLLSLSMLKFLNEFFLLQKAFHTSTDTEFLNPFNPPNCTISSAVYNLYSSLFFKKFNLFTVINEYGKPGKNVSRLEHEYVSYLEHKFPEKNFITAFNNPKGQYYFKEAYPDAYSKEFGEVVMVMGCYFHCCLNPQCTVLKNVTPQTKNRNNETFENVNIQWNNKMIELVQNNPSIKKVDHMWECEILKMKQSDPDYKLFLQANYIKSPLERLIPRKCYRGSYMDCYRLKWTLQEFPTESLQYLDINGLYSFVAITKAFMTGKYQILIGKGLNDLKVIDCKFFYRGKQVMGAILLSILPPQNLVYPFLMYRSTSGVNYNTLCKMCCEKRQKVCNHSESQRTLIGSYMINEIEYALTLNYKIIHIFECHIYEESDFILKPFIQKLNFYKTIHSNCFSNYTTKDEKQKCVDYLNEKMKLEDSVKLTVKSIIPNDGKRFFYKLLQNSFFGKFGQKRVNNRILFLSDQHQIEKLINENVILNDVSVINENICCVNLKSNGQKLFPSLYHNVYLASQITAYAREIIHKHLIELSKNSEFKLFQVNCDSLIFSMPLNAHCPLTISPAIGDFKAEVNGKILNYFSIGIKNYVLTYLSEKNELKTIHKISGLSLKSQQMADIINSKKYEDLLNKVKNNLYSSFTIPNKKQKIDLKNMTLEDLTQTYTIHNKLNVRRTVQIDSVDFKTFPYGFQSQ